MKKTEKLSDWDLLAIERLILFATGNADEPNLEHKSAQALLEKIQRAKSLRATYHQA